MAKYKGVEGGTVTGPPLCRSCSYAHYIRGKSESAVRLFCAATREGIELREEAYECSQYEDKRLPSKHAMEKTAWILRTDEFHKAIGFVSPGEWRKFRRKEGTDPDDY